MLNSKMKTKIIFGRPFFFQNGRQNGKISTLTDFNEILYQGYFAYAELKKWRWKIFWRHLKGGREGTLGTCLQSQSALVIIIILFFFSFPHRIFEHLSAPFLRNHWMEFHEILWNDRTMSLDDPPEKKFQKYGREHIFWGCQKGVGSYYRSLWENELKLIFCVQYWK